MIDRVRCELVHHVTQRGNLNSHESVYVAYGDGTIKTWRVMMTSSLFKKSLGLVLKTCRFPKVGNFLLNNFGLDACGPFG